MVSKGPIFYFIEVRNLLIHKQVKKWNISLKEVYPFYGLRKRICLSLFSFQLSQWKHLLLKIYVSTEICYKKSTKLFKNSICDIFLVILFLFPYTFSETIIANILWQMIIFLGFTVVPISLAYSHIGVRTFASNRWNNFTQSPTIILPNV